MCVLCVEIPAPVWNHSANAQVQQVRAYVASKRKASVKKHRAPPQQRHRRGAALRPVLRPSVEAPRPAALVVNADTGEIFYESHAGELRHPASLTKMMTLYLLFDAIKQGKVGMDSMIPISEHAAGMPAMNMNFTPGDRITVKTAIEAMVVRSANDVAMATAEALGGSEEGFSDMMNRTAKELGMKDTHLYNPSGLPDDRQITTAYDLVRLAIALQRDFPEYYHFFSQQEFNFRGQTYEGHNRLLGRYPGADGIKTGFIRASGYNLVTSAKRGRWRLIGVVIGGRTGASRDQEMMEMLDRVFTQLAAPAGIRSRETSWPSRQSSGARAE